eukprot:5822274-Prymnesium_polylepis.3
MRLPATCACLQHALAFLTCACLKLLSEPRSTRVAQVSKESGCRNPNFFHRTVFSQPIGCENPENVSSDGLFTADMV